MVDIFLSSKNPLYDQIGEAIKRLEEEYCAAVLFGGIVKSHAMGLDNATSDLDLQIVFCRPAPDGRKFLSHAYVMNGFDWICKDIELLEECLPDSPGERYPSYDFADQNDTKNIIISDNNRGILFRIIFAQNVWDKEGYIKSNKEKLHRHFRVLRILDSMYTRVRLYWDNYLNVEKPYLRIYLYTLHELLSAQWVYERSAIPPINFLDLLASCQDQKVIEKARELCEKNKQPLDRADMLVDRVPVLDAYIQYQTGRLKDYIADASKKPQQLLEEIWE